MHPSLLSGADDWPWDLDLLFSTKSVKDIDKVLSYHSEEGRDLGTLEINK